MSQTYEDKLSLEAFNGKLGKIEVIRSEIIKPNLNIAAVDVSGFNWDEWSVVAAILSYANTEAHYSSINTYIRLDNTDLHGLRNANGIADSTMGPIAVVLFPRRNGDNPIWALGLPYSEFGWDREKTYCDIQKINFCMSTGGWPYEMTFTMLGIR